MDLLKNHLVILFYIADYLHLAICVFHAFHELLLSGVVFLLIFELVSMDLVQVTF